jgi:predicted MFS family arabinose efflux permease
VYLFIVQWLKGQTMTERFDGLSMARVGVGLALNGFWGLGVAVFMRVMHPPR